MVKTNILGNDYKIELGDLNELELADYSGKCYGYKKKILLRYPQFMFTDGADDSEKQERFKEVLLHELVHAYSRESATHYDDDEALVDWIAIMIPKIISSYDDIIKQFQEEEANGISGSSKCV